MANKKRDKKDEVSLKDYLAAQQELEELRKANGIEKEEKGLSKWISKFFAKIDARPKHRVKKWLYITLAVVLGWCGGHRLYERRFILFAIYLAFAVIKFPNLIGFPMAMSVIDVLIAIPVQKDEKGYILI